MLPIEFPEVNVIFAEDQPEYLPLPAHRGCNGTSTSCWKLDWWERWKVFFGGRIYISQMAFGRPPQPILPGAVRQDYDGLMQAARLQAARRQATPPEFAQPPAEVSQVYHQGWKR